MDSDKPKADLAYVEPGTADPRLNGMTVEQVGMVVKHLEDAIMGICRGNDNLRATIIMELGARLIADYDEEGRGDEIGATLHKGIDETARLLREHIAKWKAEQAASNQTRKDVS